MMKKDAARRDVPFVFDKTVADRDFLLFHRKNCEHNQFMMRLSVTCSIEIWRVA